MTAGRPELVAILADVDATIGRVRALSQHPSRSAALHSLAAARRHLERVGKQPREADSRPGWYPPEPEPVVERIHQRIRESFQASREALKEIK